MFFPDVFTGVVGGVVAFFFCYFMLLRCDCI